MNPNQRTDQNIRNIETLSTAMPSADVWGQIENSLRQKKSKKGLWFLIGLSILGTSIFILANETNNYSRQTILSSNTKASALVLGSNSRTETDPFLETSLVLDAGTESHLTELSKVSAPTHNYQNRTSLHASKHTNDKQITPPQALLTVTESLNVTTEAPSKKTTKSLPSPAFKVSDLINPSSFNNEESNSDIIAAGSYKDDPCPAIGNKPNRSIFVELGGIAGLHNKKYSGTTEISTLRQDTEKEWYSWGGYAGIGIHLKQNIYIVTNMDWLQQKDKFEYSKEGISRMIIEYDPTTGEQLSSHTISGSWVSEGEITRTTLDASISLGYMFQRRRAFRNAWQIGIEPGLLYNLSLKSKGKVMIATDNIGRLEEEDFYKSSLGLGYQAQLLLEKPIKNGFRLTIKPYYRKYLINWTVSDRLKDIDVRSYGVKVGFRKVF